VDPVTRSVFSTDLPSDLSTMGDRLDRLERAREPKAADDLVASYWPQQIIAGDGNLVRAGQVTIPAGFSKMDVAAFFAPAEGSGAALTGFGIVFPPEFEALFLAGGFTEGNFGDAISRASGMALARSGRRRTSPFYIRATTDPIGENVISLGFIAVAPVDSVLYG